jgi:hypothetical protein
MSLPSDKSGAPRFRVEVPPGLWARLERLDPHSFALLNQQLESLAERAAAGDLEAAHEQRFEVDSVEVVYEIEVHRSVLVVRDVRRIET